MLKIRGCRTNNLKNVDVDIPLHKVTCVVGPSGSGKSSLVFHTIANESKRRFLNSTSSESTFFEKVPQSADVDSIFPVLPVWVLPQHNPIVGSRLNLADQFELTVSLAQLYYKDVHERCPIHLEKYASSDIEITNLCNKIIFNDVNDTEDVLHFFIGKSLYTSNLGGSASRVFDALNSEIKEFDEHSENWELFRVKSSKINSVAKKLSEFEFLKRNEAVLLIASKNSGKCDYFKMSNNQICMSCHKEGLSKIRSLDELMPFNGIGACPTCKGYGATLDYSVNKLVKYPTKSFNDGAVSILASGQFQYYEKYFFSELKKYKINLDDTYENNESIVRPILMNGSGKFPGMNEMIGWLEEKRYKSTVRIFLRSIQTENICSECEGKRIGKKAQLVKVEKDLPSLGVLLGLRIDEVLIALEQAKTSKHEVEKIKDKLKLACEFGLGDQKLTTKLKELDSNEYQKSLLLRYLSYKGSGSLFILDEPSLGLNLEEQKVLMKYIRKLSRDNTVLLVDHSAYVQENSDHIIEVGPGAGVLGGEIVYEGKYKKQKNVEFEKISTQNFYKFLTASNIDFEGHRIKNIEIPLGTISVLNSFRDSFAKKIMSEVILNELNLKIKEEKLNFDAKYTVGKIKNYSSIKNILIFENTLDRSSIRSSVGTVLGLSPYLRKYYANLPVSKSLELKEGHFSSNSELGRCSACEGKGIVEIDMQFLEDVVLKCDECEGKKISRFYSNISDGNYTIFEALNTPVNTLFRNIRVPAKAQRIIESLELLNLSYLTLDRSIPSLSGGERLRVKFLNTLQTEVKDSILYFANLSYGLSFNELIRIRALLLNLLKSNNTILISDTHPIFADFHKVEI